MATESTITLETSTETSPQEEETRKLNDETFDTEADDSASEDEIEGQDAATMDLLDQLVELFVEQNGREPNHEEVTQWIETFQSLQLDDTITAGASDKTTTEATSDDTAQDDKAPVVASE